MAINRKGYTSLIESVQEAVSQPVTEATRSKAMKTYRMNKAARAAGKAVPSLREARWASGEALSHQLNNMQNNAPTPTASDSGKGKVRSRKNPLARTSSGTSSSTNASSSPKGPAASSASSVVSEDWDILDEILAEGMELYGEDGLAEILADFAETGEISDELALLLSDE